MALAGCCSGASLRALNEFHRPDPFGGVVESDRKGAAVLGKIEAKAARGGYASFHLIVEVGQGSDYALSTEFPLAADLYREWFHATGSDRRYYPDALIPVTGTYRSQMPEPDNKIPGQKAQAFWVDIWIPESTKPGPYRGQAKLVSGGASSVLPIEIDVVQAAVPDTDPVLLDSNSYGTSWLFEQYPKTLASGGEDELFRMIHAYHRIFYEHRGVFHQLGYGHAGKVGPEFAPEVTGEGTHKHISSWDRFDRHYGPLLDGSAFAGTRRGARPIPFMYLPINPEWPASYLWWGEPGYETEFVNVVSEMERHFREKGWTHTNLEVFFNQKKRYKGFNWDGDEIRFERDNRNLAEYGRLLAKAVPHDSPVRFVMRADTSWTMEHQLDELSGVIRMWVAGEGTASWYPDAIRRAMDRGDIVWTYGGTPAVDKVAAQITLNPLRSWMSGVGGFVRWLAVSPGPDPWFRFGGGAETLVYPGERFGIPGPLPSIRLKLQRNCLQDMALLKRSDATEIARRFNGTMLAEWRNSRPALVSKPVLDWNNTDIDEALQPFEARFQNLDPEAWLRVRELVVR